MFARLGVAVFHPQRLAAITINDIEVGIAEAHQSGIRIAGGMRVIDQCRAGHRLAVDSGAAVLGQRDMQAAVLAQRYRTEVSRTCLQHDVVVGCRTYTAISSLEPFQSNQAQPAAGGSEARHARRAQLLNLLGVGSGR